MSGSEADVVANPGNDLGPLLDRAPDDPKKLLALFDRRIGFHVQDSDSLPDGIEHIVEIVGNAGCHLTHSALAFGVGDVALQIDEFGDVADHQQRTDDLTLLTPNRTGTDEDLLER